MGHACRCYRLCRSALWMVGAWGLSGDHLASTKPPETVAASEGSLEGIRVASSMKPGGTAAAFYNPKRRVGRDCSVLSVAQWMIDKQQSSSKQKKNDASWSVLDAHTASGMAGLRVAVESPLLAEAGCKSKATADSAPSLQVLLNDVDSEAVQVATCNAETASTAATTTKSSIAVSHGNAQALWHDTSFDVSLLDPFGCTTACLDAALAHAPHGGLIDVCATDVTVLYGGRPAVAARHYGAFLSSSPRPPCFQERGVRLLLAAVAQAAGRQDRGIQPLVSLCTAHYVVVTVQVARRGLAKSAAMQHVQRLPICRVCGAPGSTDKTSAPLDCSCNASTRGADTVLEGPLWLGPLHDASHVEGMMHLANLPQAQIAVETKRLLQTLYEESVISSTRGLFHRRPSLAAPGRMPHLDTVVTELQRRDFPACRTQFDPMAVKSNASPREFDEAVRALL